MERNKPTAHKFFLVVEDQESKICLDYHKRDLRAARGEMGGEMSPLLLSTSYGQGTCSRLRGIRHACSMGWFSLFKILKMLSFTKRIFKIILLSVVNSESLGEICQQNLTLKNKKQKNPTNLVWFWKLEKKVCTRKHRA